MTAKFDDNSFVSGSLLVACDGAHSRVRRALFPDQCENYRIPVRMIGVKFELPPEDMVPIRNVDPFFFQGAHSRNDSFLYYSCKSVL